MQNVDATPIFTPLYFLGSTEAPLYLQRKGVILNISISFGDRALQRLTPSMTASQSDPKRFYVYGHFDEQGIPFYIGKGTGRRAWSDVRHSLWYRYVQHHLQGKYSVVILADDLTSAEAENIESDWISQESETLVNWVNLGRKTDFKLLDQFHKLRDANRELVASTRVKEKSDTEEAIKSYYQALANIEAYATIQAERGLVGRLIDEEREENGISGDLSVLDRLTLCLVRTGRREEAKTVTEQYFEKYRLDEKLSAAEPINKRISRK